MEKVSSINQRINYKANVVRAYGPGCNPIQFHGYGKTGHVSPFLGANGKIEGKR